MAQKTYYRYVESGEVYALTYAPSAPGWEQLSTRAGKEARKAYVREELRGILHEGSRLGTVCTHVSSSGMSRAIRVYAPATEAGGHSRDISALVADALDMRESEAHGGVLVGGCGMDMGFHLVDTLAYALYGTGTALRHSWL